MNLKLVFRVLRRISLWSQEYYSEIYVVGQENIPPDGPLIVAPSHHNELIDVATLCTTMPHRRRVCFWAKASMFAHPVARWVMSSSGAIPVKRNPNNARNASVVNGVRFAADHLAKSSLFRDTFHALDVGELIAMFPEGTSYTEPQIAQVKDGAALAALEYAKWCNEHSDCQTNGALVFVPVGIVYTSKSKYQTRVRVEYGEPIDISVYAKHYLAACDGDTSRAVVKELTAEVERALVGMTVNAPDWDTWFAAMTTRDIAWSGSRNIPLKDWVRVSQSFINIFADDTEVKSAAAIVLKERKVLVAYSGLLHYTGMSHGDFLAVYPVSTLPSASFALETFGHQLLKTVLHPRFLFFIPPCLLHIPVYVAGSLTARYITKPDEEETIAEFKVVSTGLIYGLTSFGLGSKFATMLLEGTLLMPWVPSIFSKTGKWLQQAVPSMYGARRVMFTAAIVYCTTWLFFWWHSTLVKENYRQFKRLAVSWKVLLGTLSSPSNDVPKEQLEDYSRPPLPALNSYIKRRDPVQAGDDVRGRTRVVRPSNPTMLIRHLFAARSRAEEVVGELGNSGIGKL